MKLPTQKECLDYFTEYKVPDNIFRHCCQVRKVAVFLARQLQQKQVPINVEFVSCLGYFHDLCKMIVLKDFVANEFHKDAIATAEQKEFWKEMQKKYPDHYEGEMAYELFKDKYPELALALRSVSSPKNQDPSWEQLIVHYADLRVLREKVVLVSERLAYLRQRYPRSDELWSKHEQKLRLQEQEIFSKLSFVPDQLAEEIEKDMNLKDMNLNMKINKSSKTSSTVQHGQ